MQLFNFLLFSVMCNTSLNRTNDMLYTTRKLQYCTTSFFSVVLFFLLPFLLSVNCNEKKKRN